VIPNRSEHALRLVGTGTRTQLRTAAVRFVGTIKRARAAINCSAPTRRRIGDRDDETHERRDASRIVEATGWQRHASQGLVSILGSKSGEKIEPSKNAAGERCCRIAK
jgi:hypothetical protein